MWVSNVYLVPIQTRKWISDRAEFGASPQVDILKGLARVLDKMDCPSASWVGMQSIQCCECCTYANNFAATRRVSEVLDSALSALIEDLPHRDQKRWTGPDCCQAPPQSWNAVFNLSVAISCSACRPRKSPSRSRSSGKRCGPCGRRRIDCRNCHCKCHIPRDNIGRKQRKVP